MSILSLVKWSPYLTRLVYNVIYARHAIRQRCSFVEDIQRIKSLKNKHLGQRCFIIGTGPSLTLSDLDLLKGEITFASNRIYELLNKTSWRPTYYMCQDHDIINRFGDNIATIDADMMFIPVEYKKRFTDGKFRFFVLQERLYYPNMAKFSKNASKAIQQGYTVTYGAIQMAVYMGFSEIYLLGIDHNYNVIRDSKGRPVRQSQDNNKNYSETMTEYTNMNNLPRIEESTIAYETAEIATRKMGVRVYNATRGGKLEAFERVDLLQVLNK